MRIKLPTKSVCDETIWHKYWAWHPVKIDNYWVWLETVMRKKIIISYYNGEYEQPWNDVEYKFIEEKDND